MNQIVKDIYACIYVCMHIYAGWVRSKFIVVCMENNTLINDNTRINSVFNVLTTVNVLLLHPECTGFIT